MLILFYKVVFSLEMMSIQLDTLSNKARPRINIKVPKIRNAGPNSHNIRGKLKKKLRVPKV